MSGEIRGCRRSPCLERAAAPPAEYAPNRRRTPSRSCRPLHPGGTPDRAALHAGASCASCHGNRWPDPVSNTCSSREASIDPGRAADPGRSARVPVMMKAELLPIKKPTVPGAQRSPSRSGIHALLPDLLDDRPATAVGRYERELAVDARVLESRLSRCAGGLRRSRVLPVCPFGPFLGVWLVLSGGYQMGFTVFLAEGCSSYTRNSR